jgi:hypothetical protein
MPNQDVVTRPLSAFEETAEWAREGRRSHVRVGYAIKFDRHRIADWIRAREMAVPVQPYRAFRR